MSSKVSALSLSPLASAFVFALSLPALVQAEDFVITSQEDLDDAISAIHNWEAEGYEHTITFSSELSGTLELNAFYIYDQMLSIDGAGASGLTLNIGVGPDTNLGAGVRSDNASVSFSNININIERDVDEAAPYREAEGFALYSESSLNLNNVTITHNAENGFVRTVYSNGYSSISISNSTLTGAGVAEGEGANYSYSNAIQAYRSADVSIVDSTFSGFYSYYGAVSVRGHYSESASLSVTVTGSTFTGNTGYGSSLAPALNIQARGAELALTIDSSVFSYNHNTSRGSSAIYLSSTNNGYSVLEAQITNTSIFGNSTESYILRRGGSEGEGALALVGENGYLNVLLANVTITNNEGGAISARDNAVRYVEYSGHYGNDAPLSLVMAHVTIANNEGEGNTPAVTLYFENADSEVFIVNSIIANNENTYYQGGEGDGSWVSYDNDITINSNSPIDIEARNSLIGVEDYSEGGSKIVGNNNLFGVDPKLGSFGDHGGATPTLALKASSPAIDAGNQKRTEELMDFLNSDEDQNGNDRIQGCAPDMGAVEFASADDLVCEEQEPEPTATGKKKKKGGLFGSFGFEFLAAVFALGWLRRKVK